jgi:GNAT superfamily N-acetyltransferase
MADLLVQLYDLPALDPALERAAATGCEIRRALAPEKHVVTRWIGERFPEAWKSECEIAFTRAPVACFLALCEGRLCGFAAYEATCRNFFGPIGVDERFRGHSIGGALLLSVLHAMHAEGYAYAIVGFAGATDFFERIAGATPIAGSDPGIYRGLLKKQDSLP